MIWGFWEKIKRPVVGLAPMDGVTDAAFRYISAKYGHPSVIFTEFVAVEGIVRGVPTLYSDLIYNELERPIVAQLFGANPESFYKAAFVVSALGFDGIDINMGCSDKSVVGKQGAGAALILKPGLAKEIIRMVKEGVADYAAGRKLSGVGLSAEAVDQIHNARALKKCRQEGLQIPVSVKTRLGFDRPIIREWLNHLLEAEPTVITIHGRTLKQGFTGQADWKSIGEAVQVAKGSRVMILGNGDVKDYADALRKIEYFGVDGVLIGRAALGNPWVFKKATSPAFKERLKVLLEQAEYFSRFLPDKPFATFRKNFGWYCREFNGAVFLRDRLMRAGPQEEVRFVLNNFLDRVS